jgi:hypothetical protein
LIYWGGFVPFGVDDIGRFIMVPRSGHVPILATKDNTTHAITIRFVGYVLCAHSFLVH